MAYMKFSRDANGNKVIQIKPDNERGFSIQTNGNLPEIHRMSEIDTFKACNELEAYRKKGLLTKRQDRILRNCF